MSEWVSEQEKERNFISKSILKIFLILTNVKFISNLQTITILLTVCFTLSKHLNKLRNFLYAHDGKISIQVPLKYHLQVVHEYTENYTSLITYRGFISRSAIYMCIYIYMYIESPPPNLIGMHINTGTLTEAAINYPSVTRNAVQSIPCTLINWVHAQ